MKLWHALLQANEPMDFGLAAALVAALPLVLALDQLGFDVTALIAGLGIGGVALTLAVQSILGDVFACAAIALDKPFVVGDFIVVDGLRGTVENVGLKTTRVRSLDGELLVFANADLLKSRVRNFKRMRERRIQFGVGVTYGTAPDKPRATAIRRSSSRSCTTCSSPTTTSTWTCSRA